MNARAGLLRRLPLLVLAVVIGQGSPVGGAEASVEYVLQRDRVGLVRLGISRKALQADTYDRAWMKALFMDLHLNAVEITLPGVSREETSRRPLASMIVHLDGNRPDGGVVMTVDAQDPRFRTTEGLGPASLLGDLRALHPDLELRHEVFHESFDGMKAGDRLAEVHHPSTVIDGMIFLLRPANYLTYRPSDGLPDDTPVQLVRIGG